MNSPLLDLLMPMDQIELAAKPTEWLWEGIVGRGCVTLLVSRWKTGKTTLIAGVLRALGGGDAFLDRRCAAAQAVIVSEESVTNWANRVRAITIGANARLVSRPFPGRPTPDQWADLVAEVGRLRSEAALDVFVVDPLAMFLPGLCESDPGTLADLFGPLRRLADAGMAIVVAHHPRKKRKGENIIVRGGRALLDSVDIHIDLSRYGSSPADEYKRRLVGRSRFAETPRSLIYEWTPGTGDFRTVPDVLSTRFREHWETIRTLLARRASAATHRQLLTEWLPSRPAPSAGQLYEWLARAAREGLAIRFGKGTKPDPYRFQLPDGDHRESSAIAMPLDRTADFASWKK